MLSNLSNKYLIDEEEKYTFIPQINTRDSNYYAYIQSLYEIPHKNLQNNSEQNGQKIITLNKIKNLKNNLGKYSNQDINNKYLPYMENKNISKNKSNNYSDIGVKNYKMKNDFRAKLRNPFPFSNNINNNYNSSYLFDFLEEPENGKNYYKLNDNNINQRKIMNKSFSCIKNSSYPLTKRNDFDNKSHTLYNVSFPSNNLKISRNSEYKKIIIPKKNGKNIEHEKRLFHSNNSSMTSSIGSLILKKSILLKSKRSPEKRQGQFSFGSELINYDNKNLNNKRVKIQNQKNNLTQRNSSIKSVNYSIRSQRAQASTKSSGTNTISCYNNYMLNGNKEKEKNGIEKKNNFEIQSINEYSIINDSDNLANENLNIQTTLQTLNDSKILDLANNYISEDDSLERYKRKVGI